MTTSIETTMAKRFKDARGEDQSMVSILYKKGL
jgi:hypothetical protein